MDLERTITTIALPALVLSISFASWFLWFHLSGRSNELKTSLLRKFAEILTQLDDIATLQEEFNQVCAARSLGARFDLESSPALPKYVAVIQADYREMEGLPAWKVLNSYPRYWLHAEAHARYVAPLEDQLRDAIKDIQHTTAP